MNTTSITRPIVRLTAAAVSALTAALVLLAPTQAVAREGAQSVGKGMKCYYTYSTDPVTGVTTAKQVCYKSV